MQTEKQTAMANEALGRARSGQSLANESICIQEFAQRGINPADILPRENVLTFWAWKALGRSVRKGEHGVKLITWIPFEREKDGKVETAYRPKTAVVFHVSQTDPIPGAAQHSFEFAKNQPAPRPRTAPQTTAPEFTYYSDEFKQVG